MWRNMSNCPLTTWSCQSITKTSTRGAISARDRVEQHQVALFVESRPGAAEEQVADGPLEDAQLHPDERAGLLLRPRYLSQLRHRASRIGRAVPDQHLADPREETVGIKALVRETPRPDRPRAGHDRGDRAE